MCVCVVCVHCCTHLQKIYNVRFTLVIQCKPIITSIEIS